MAMMVVPEKSSRAIKESYGNSTPYSMGVEEEFQLLQPTTFDLVPRATQMLAEVAPDDATIKPELMQSVIESATPVCRNAAEADEHLRSQRAQLARLAESAGCLLGSAGTHPFSRYEFQKVTEKERYADIISRLKWVAQRELIFGLHVHIGIDSREKAVAVFNGIRTYLPHVLALSANSPFWQGRHTGLEATRVKIFDSFPRSGMPQDFADWAAWEQMILRGIDCGFFQDETYIWWDVRLHPGYGTIEVRIADAQTRVEDSSALAAFIQGLAAWIGTMHDLGRDIPTHPKIMLDENKWRATRFGLDAEFVDLDTDTMVPVRDQVQTLLDTITPYSAELGSDKQLAGIESMLEKTPAERQLELYDKSESLVSVAEMIHEETVRV